MVWELDIVLLVLAVISALRAVAARDLLVSVILLGTFGMFMCLVSVSYTHLTLPTKA